MRAVVLGASRGMGRSLARALVARGDRVFLLGRNAVDLERSARDLTVRGDGPAVGTAPCDLADPATFAPALERAAAELGGIDCVIVTAALFATQDRLEADRDLLRNLLDVNFTGTILFCEAARERLLAAGGGTLCVFSSVAGDRGRKPIALYGASKAGLSAYLEALDHKFRAAGLVTVCVKPGFIKTSMTEGLPVPPFAGEPERVAHDVLRAIDKGKPMVYTPWPWLWIMLVIRALPRFVMRRISF